MLLLALLVLHQALLQVRQVLRIELEQASPERRRVLEL